MPQNDLTIRVPLVRSREDKLRENLAMVNQNPADNPLLPFSVHENLHFARFLIMDGPDPQTYGTSLVFMANIDGPVDVFLDRLVTQSPEGLDTLFEACQGYPPKRKRSRTTRMAFLQRQRITSQAYYVNTLGRNARQIRQEDELYQALQDFIDDIDPAAFATALQLRAAIIDFVATNPELSWALSARAKPGVLWRTWERLRFAVLASLGVLIVAWGWPALLFWLVTLRIREIRDLEFSHRPALSRLNQLRSSEDMSAHNPFAAVGYVKPGKLRLLTAKSLLASAQVVLRHVFNRGDLAGVPLLGLNGVDTIHFARWTLIDDDRRLLFTSNYDGSLESYMVDFIDKVAWGLNLIFSNGVGYPRTRWLVFGGARKEQRFKDYLGLHQLENAVWYTPYPHLTAVNMANNAAVRDGLRGRMSENEAQAWLRRF